MARSLVSLGLLVLAIGACTLLAEEFDWVGQGALAHTWFPVLLRVGVACVVAGVALAALSPLTRSLRGGRCARCRRRIERGQTYCADHLRETVNEYQDLARRNGAL